MANDADLVWNEFYKYCLEKIGKDDKTVEMYLQTCMPVSLANGVLLVDVATPFAMEQIRNRYMDRMQKLIAETGFASELRFSVSENHEGKEEKIPSRVSQPQHEPEQPPKRTASKNGLNPNYSSSASRTAFRTPRAWPSPSRPETPTTRSLYGERSDSERRT